MKGKMVLDCPGAIMTLCGTVSGACALREIAVAAPAGPFAAPFRDTVQVPDPPLGIDAGEHINEVN